MYYNERTNILKGFNSKLTERAWHDVNFVQTSNQIHEIDML